MKAYGRVDVYIHIFLTSALVRGEWSTSRPGRFTFRERAPSTHWIGGWLDQEPVWKMWSREDSLFYGDSNSNPSVIQSVASRLPIKLSRLPISHSKYIFVFSILSTLISFVCVCFCFLSFFRYCFLCNWPLDGRVSMWMNEYRTEEFYILWDTTPCT
jgi:hypothetical protein